MLSSTDQSQIVVDEILDIFINNFQFKGNVNQIKASIHPVIANSMFKRDKELLQKERLETLITLSRTLDNQNIEAVINALNYEIVLKK